MNIVVVLLIIPFLISFAISFLSSPLVIKLANKFNLIDDPSKNKHPKVIHKYPIPRGGGLAIFLSVFISILFFLPTDKHVIGILLGALILVVTGLLDDKYNLSPYLRLVLQFIAASMPVIFGIGIAFLTNPIHGGVIDLSFPRLSFEFFGMNHTIWILSDLFGIFWIVFLMNVLNMGAKGVDGQLTGVSGIAALFIALLSFKFSADIAEWPVTILAAITAGAFFGFLPYHIYPQKIMPSFSGSNLAGYLLGILSILTTTKVGALVLVLGIPLIDTGYVVVRRILSGKSPVWGDRGHLHHKLLDLGFNKRTVAFIYWGFTLILGLLALQLNPSFKFYTIILVFGLFFGFIIWLTYRKQKKI